MRYFKTVKLPARVFRVDIEVEKPEDVVVDRWNVNNWEEFPQVLHYVSNYDGDADAVIVEISKADAEALIGQTIEEDDDELEILDDVQEALDGGMIEGSETSGNFGHAGRPGEVGGSGAGGAGELDPNEVRQYTTLPQKDMGLASNEEIQATGDKTAAVVNMDRDLFREEFTAIMDYTAIGNGAVNRWLKGYDISTLSHNEQAVATMIEHMDKLMGISRTNTDITLFRGVSFDKARKLELIADQKGTFTDKGYVSTSTQKDITRDFGIQVKILIPKGFPAISIPKLATHPHKQWENEIILNRNVTFKVDKISIPVPGTHAVQTQLILRPINMGHK